MDPQLVETNPKTMGVVTPPLSETDWVTLLHDGSRSGGHGAPLLPAPTRARWQSRTGGAVRSSPVLRDGILYVASLSGSVYALNVETGRAKWTFRAAAQIHS